MCALAKRDEFAGFIQQALSVPTHVLYDDADLCNHPATSEGREHYFSRPCRRTVCNGVGHFPSGEAPQAAAAEILTFL
ncbi:alpha/beta fold hydrolase [Paraburkholderia jirisanensis]